MIISYMATTYLNLNKVINYILLRLIRVSNLVLVLSIFLYFGELFTGLPIESIIVGSALLWSGVIGSGHDPIQQTTKKIMGLDWGMSIVLFLSIMTIFWQNKTQTINIIKAFISKTCTKH